MSLLAIVIVGLVHFSPVFNHQGFNGEILKLGGYDVIYKFCKFVRRTIRQTYGDYTVEVFFSQIYPYEVLVLGADGNLTLTGSTFEVMKWVAQRLNFT